MSYRCQECRTVCNHQQIRVVTETRMMPNHTVQIAQEKALCEECARKYKGDVKVNPAKNGALSQRPIMPANVVGSA